MLGLTKKSGKSHFLKNIFYYFQCQGALWKDLLKSLNFFFFLENNYVLKNTVVSYIRLEIWLAYAILWSVGNILWSWYIILTRLLLRVFLRSSSFPDSWKNCEVTTGFCSRQANNYPHIQGVFVQREVNVINVIYLRRKKNQFDHYLLIDNNIRRKIWNEESSRGKFWFHWLH